MSDKWYYHSQSQPPLPPAQPPLPPPPTSLSSIRTYPPPPNQSQPPLRPAKPPLPPQPTLSSIRYYPPPSNQSHSALPPAQPPLPPPDISSSSIRSYASPPSQSHLALPPAQPPSPPPSMPSSSITSYPPPPLPSGPPLTIPPVNSYSQPPPLLSKNPYTQPPILPHPESPSFLNTPPPLFGRSCPQTILPPQKSYPPPILPPRPKTSLEMTRPLLEVREKDRPPSFMASISPSIAEVNFSIPPPSLNLSKRTQSIRPPCGQTVPVVSAKPLEMQQQEFLDKISKKNDMDKDLRNKRSESKTTERYRSPTRKYKDNRDSRERYKASEKDRSSRERSIRKEAEKTENKPIRSRDCSRESSKGRDSIYKRSSSRERNISKERLKQNREGLSLRERSISSRPYETTSKDAVLKPRLEIERKAPSLQRDSVHRESRSRNVSMERSGIASRQRDNISRASRERNVSTAKENTLSLRERRKDDSNELNERKEILIKWRKNYCHTEQQITERLEEMSKNLVDFVELEKHIWIRSTPSELHYERDENNLKVTKATRRLEDLYQQFDSKLLKLSKKLRDPDFKPKPQLRNVKVCNHNRNDKCHNDSSDSSECSDEENLSDEENFSMKELERKQQHPDRLHSELWYNDPGEMNDGPLCRCSFKSRKTGIRHGIYPGETSIPKCNVFSNNADKLYHYRIIISPPTNFLINVPTIINHDEHEFIFEGFSIFSHQPLVDLPVCKVIRFNIEYTISYYEEKLPDNFVVGELDLFTEYIFHELLELVDLELTTPENSEHCSRFHFMPRFVRELNDNGKEILCMEIVLQYLLASYVPLIQKEELKCMVEMSQYDWQNFADELKGMIVTYPGKKPSSVRVDQLDRNIDLQQKDNYMFPEIVHFGIRPPQLSYAGNPEYQKAWREYVKFRHLIANMSKPTFDDKRKLEMKENRLQEIRTQGKMKRDVTVAVSAEALSHLIGPPQLRYAGNPEYQKAWREYVKFRHLIANMSKPTFDDKLEMKENRLQEIRTQGKMKRDVTVAVSAEGFYRTGVMCDIIQHAMLIPVLVCHLRFHNSLDELEKNIGYQFQNRGLIQLALTHPSYRQNFGTNPDHARNSLTNCGIRQPEYGDRRIHYMNTRKRGINTLINIMSRFGKNQETESNITHNERLEFLGDAVVEFLSSIHLFFSFADLEEGGLATYRAAIVQNQHLAILAKTLKLDHFMLYAHGSDLCHDLELKHAMANCFEALMGALFLDGGIDVADRVFSRTLYQDSPDLLKVWVDLPPHPLQEQEPSGDRHWIEKFEILQKLTEFERSINVEFNHIRLLARAFTDRSVGYTNLTLGSNQRLEFLGDTVLQLIASEYLYKYFPEHHEGHLSLLRSSLVNNRTQSVVCDDLGMAQYAIYNNPKPELKTKDRADLLEAFIGALYVDRGIEYCEVFCQVTLFPRLQDFIMNQDWNDPKSKLQQCCLTLRTMDGGEPDIPVYKVIECKGPTNTRVYTVAVYFRGKRLASAMGHSIQQAEMNAAKQALDSSQDLFPQLDHQRRVIAKSMKRQRKRKKLRSLDDLRRKSPESYSRNRFKSRSRSRGRSKRRSRSSSRDRSSSRSTRSFNKKCSSVESDRK